MNSIQFGPSCVNLPMVIRELILNGTRKKYNKVISSVGIEPPDINTGYVHFCRIVTIQFTDGTHAKHQLAELF